MSSLIHSYSEYPEPTVQPSDAALPEKTEAQETESKKAELEGTSITCEDRWQVYHRLQELDVVCSCGGFKPLQVQVTTPTEAMQLWAVLRRVSLSRKQLAEILQQCWRLSASP